MRTQAKVLGCFALLATGCAHQAAATWDPSGRRLCHAQACYRVGSLPPPWRLARVEQAGRTFGAGFIDDGHAAVIQCSATCPLDAQAEAAPLGALANQLLIGYSHRRLEGEREGRLAGRATLERRASAELDGVPVVLDLVVLRRDGCLFDFALVAPPAALAGARPAFDAFLAGFVDERAPAG